MKEAYEQIAKDFDPSKVALMKQVAKRFDKWGSN